MPDSRFAVIDRALVPASRYYSLEFFESERQRLWSSTWQAACRLEEIPSAGDFVEYRIAGSSILVVRQPDDSVKAFENACRHRGTALGIGSGAFKHGQIVCPFHGWRFDLGGECTYIYGKRGFRPDTIAVDHTRLVECQVALRWGMVWVNQDSAARTFEATCGQIGPVLDEIGLESARTNWWRQIKVKANWKIALEAFLEAYHVLQTHPELADGAVGDEYDADTSSYTLDEDYGHGWINDSPVVPIRDRQMAEYLVLVNRVLHDGVEGWLTSDQRNVLEELWALVPEKLSEDEFLEQFYVRVYADGEKNGTPLPARPALGLGFVFPNIALINNLGNSMIYRFLPDDVDPEACTWEIWSVSPAPPSAPLVKPTKVQLSYQRELPFVYAQDASNMELQQIGIHSRGFRDSLYSPNYEALIPNMHRQIDRYLFS